MPPCPITSNGQDGLCGWSGDISMIANNCPDCGRPMDIIPQVDGDTFVCRCGYRHLVDDDTKPTDYEDWCQRE